MPSFEIEIEDDPYFVNGQSNPKSSPQANHSPMFYSIAQTSSSHSTRSRNIQLRGLLVNNNSAIITSENSEICPEFQTLIDTRCNGRKRHRSLDTMFESQKCQFSGGLGIVIDCETNEIQKTGSVPSNDPIPVLDKSSESGSSLVSELADDFLGPPSSPIIISSPFQLGTPILDNLSRNDDFFMRNEIFYVPTYTAPRTIKPSDTLDYLEESKLACGRTFYDYSNIRSPLFSFAMHSPISFGLVADINMFDKKEHDNQVFVRPQDLLMNQSSAQCQQEVTSLFIKTEETDKDVIGSTHTLSTFVNEIKEHETPQDSVSQEDLPSFYLENSCLTPSDFSEKISLQDVPRIISRTLERLPGSSAFQPLTSHEVPFTPISSAILETMEAVSSPPRKKKKLKDITNVYHQQTTTNVKLGTNVLELFESTIPQDITLHDTYLGVSGEEMAQKTKYYMMMNPGKRLSDELIFTFAGRLSESRMPMPGYRCYLKGCSKLTKRKDHMGDHVRTHLGEKPFHCGVCGLGFIRHNDCQRHEANHRPDKKFSCDCGAAFSRRDLYVRHQKTACSSSNYSSIRAPSRKAAKFNKFSVQCPGRKGNTENNDIKDPDYVPNRAWITPSI